MRGQSAKSAARHLAAALASCVIVSLAGCAGENLLSWKKAEIPEATAAEPVLEVLCLWQPAEGQGLDDKPSRGFNGQIMFFTRKRSAPVKVDGDVLVYLFDDRGEGDAKTKPIHQFHFPSDAWQTHMVVGNLGPSYQLFIPYVRGDRYKADCALRVRLTPKAGPVANSELSTVALPGPDVPVNVNAETQASDHAAIPAKAGAQNPAGASAARGATDHPLSALEPAQRAAASRGTGEQIDLGSRRGDGPQSFTVHSIGELHPLKRSGMNGVAQPSRQVMPHHPLSSSPAVDGTDFSQTASIAHPSADTPRQFQLRAATEHESQTSPTFTHPLAAAAKDRIPCDTSIVKEPKRLNVGATASARPLQEPHPLVARSAPRNTGIRHAAHTVAADDRIPLGESVDLSILDTTTAPNQDVSTERADLLFDGVKTADWQVQADDKGR